MSEEEEKEKENKWCFVVARYIDSTIHGIIISTAIWSIVLGGIMLNDHVKDETNCYVAVISTWLLVYGVAALVSSLMSIIIGVVSCICPCKKNAILRTIVSFFSIFLKWGPTILSIVAFIIITSNTFGGCQVASEPYGQKYYPYLLPLIITYWIVTSVVLALVVLSCFFTFGSVCLLLGCRICMASGHKDAELLG